MLADAAADDEEVGGEEPLDVRVVPLQPGRPLRPRQALRLAHGGGRAGLRDGPVDLEVAELAVRHEDPVVEERRPDAGAEGREDDEAVDALRGTVAQLGDPGGVGSIAELVACNASHRPPRARNSVSDRCAASSGIRLHV